MFNKLQKYHYDDEQPNLSVLLTVYNGGNYLIPAIESILCQTFQNFELIIIDDGSTDRSIEILNHYKSIDKRIVLVSRENKGLVTTLNEALSLARAPWVARMDQDDICVESRFEKQIKWLEQTGADICGSWIKFFDGENSICKYYESDEAVKFDMLFKSPFAHPTVMMRTEYARRLGYDLDFEKAEDYDLWIRAAMDNWKMGNVQEVLLHYRRHDTQMTKISSLSTQEASARLRARYWRYNSQKYNLNTQNVLEVQNLISSKRNTDMNSANFAFCNLLKNSSGESRKALTDNISHLYIKASVDIDNLSQYWRELTQNQYFVNAFSVQFKLYLISLFRLKKDTFLYSILNHFYKKIY